MFKNLSSNDLIKCLNYKYTVRNLDRFYQVKFYSISPGELPGTLSSIYTCFPFSDFMDYNIYLYLVNPQLAIENLVIHLKSLDDSNPAKLDYNLYRSSFVLEFIPC